MDIKINYKGKRILIKNLIVCDNFFSKFRGLMFRQEIKPLIFIFNKPVKDSIHSFFVFKPFRAIWILNNKVIDDKIIKPWSFYIKPKGFFDTLLELPLEEGKKYFEITDEDRKI